MESSSFYNYDSSKYQETWNPILSKEEENKKLEKEISELADRCLQIIESKCLSFDKLEVYELLKPFIDSLSYPNSNAKAQYCLAACYAHGNGVDADAQKAFNFYKLSADHGYVKAQNAIAIYFSLGCGVKEDRAEAFRYYQLAADQGHPASQYHIGAHYYYDKDDPENIKKGIKYYQLSADQGYSQAQYMLARCYKRGEGVTPDMDMATKYYKLAAENGYGLAVSKMQKLDIKRIMEQKGKNNPGGNISLDFENDADSRKLMELLFDLTLGR